MANMSKGCFSETAPAKVAKDLRMLGDDAASKASAGLLDRSGTLGLQRIWRVGLEATSEPRALGGPARLTPTWRNAIKRL